MRRALCLFVALAALLAPAAGAAGKSCITPHKVEFARGPSPLGPDWTASASVKKNGNCREWLFGVDFTVPGAYNWGSGTGIRVGRHTDPYFNISGFDFPLSGGETGVVGGYVGREVATIKLSMSDGRAIEIHPRLPRVQLRHKFVWMRGFRYFLRYYEGKSHVDAFRLFDRAGTLLYRKLNAEGELW